MRISQLLVVKLRSVLGPFSALIYFACWAPFPAAVLGPISFGLVWASILIWLLARTRRGTLHWNRLSRVALVVIWCLHESFRWFVQEIPTVHAMTLPVYAVITVGPDVYLRMGSAAHSLSAFGILLGPWQRVQTKSEKAGGGPPAI
jgi:hypothetical protein